MLASFAVSCVSWPYVHVDRAPCCVNSEQSHVDQSVVDLPILSSLPKLTVSHTRPAWLVTSVSRPVSKSI